MALLALILSVVSLAFGGFLFGVIRQLIACNKLAGEALEQIAVLIEEHL